MKEFFKKVGHFFKNIFVADDKSDAKIVILYRKKGTKTFISSLISIAIGVGIGFILMLFAAILNPRNDLTDAFVGLGKILAGPFANPKYALTNLGNMIFYAVPLIFTGLSFGIANKTGLFNIGAPGQFIMGTLGALLVALNINTVGNRGLGVLVWILALLAGMVLGALWGMIPGLLKALFGINEVIICIMTNWISAQILTWVFTSTKYLHNVEGGKSAYLIKPEVMGNYTPSLGFDKLFQGSYIDIGIIIAIVAAIAIWIIMNKTTFGYELKACGANSSAAKYAGMSEKRNIILSMTIAGALSGLGAALYYLNARIELLYGSVYQNLPAYGFNGIPTALLANNDAIGTIFSALFIRYIGAGGNNLSSAGFNKGFADIIVAVIIYLSGFAKIFRDLLQKREIMVENLSERRARTDDLPASKKGGKK